MPWTIDRLAFATVDNDFIDAEPEEHDIKRSGGDGTAFQRDAYRAPVRQPFTTVVMKAPNEYAAFYRACKLLETVSSVTCTDQYGITRTVKVNRVRIQPTYIPTGQIQVLAQWLITPRSVRPS